jgi:hypothetical protein
MANLPPITHEKVQVVMTIENGQVIDTRKVRDNELIASMDTFFWMAKKAGYQVIALIRKPVALTAIRIPERVHLQALQVLLRYRRKRICAAYAPHRLSQPEG